MSLEQENHRLRNILAENLGYTSLWSEEAEVRLGDFGFPTVHLSHCAGRLHIVSLRVEVQVIILSDTIKVFGHVLGHGIYHKMKIISNMVVQTIKTQGQVYKPR